MKKIKLKKPFSLNGKRLEGEQELPDRIADALIGRGVAEEAKPPARKPTKKTGGK